MLPAIQPQHLEHFDLKQGKGVLALNLGGARVIESYSKLIQIIELNDIKNNFIKVNSTLSKIKKLMEHHKISDTILVTIAERRINKLEIALYNILPDTYKPRQKRGLFNPLGTFIKAITGNVDQEDYEELQNSIKKLENGRYELVDKLNDQIKINDQLISQNKIVVDHINNISIQMTEWINIAKTSEKHFIQTVYLDRLFVELYDKIMIVQEQIDEVHDILTFAKINIISRHILDNEQMEYVTEEFDKDGIKIHSEEQIYALLKIKAFYNNTDLIVIVEIPQFNNQPFNLYKIKTYPVNNQIISQSYNHVILNLENYMIINNLCPMVEQTYMCQLNQIHKINGNCIPELMNNKNASCNTLEVESTEEVTLLEDGYLYIASPKGISIVTTCNLKNAQIIGIKLIKFSQCSITVNNRRYTNNNNLHRRKITLIQPLDNVEINITMQKFMDLPLIAKQTIKNLEKINVGNHQNQVFQYTFAVSSTILIFIIILIVFVIHRKYKDTFSTLKDKFLQQLSKQNVEDDLRFRREELCITHIQQPRATRATSSNLRKSASTNDLHLSSNI